MEFGFYRQQSPRICYVKDFCVLNLQPLTPTVSESYRVSHGLSVIAGLLVDASLLHSYDHADD